jgi:hypothetical protein
MRRQRLTAAIAGVTGTAAVAGALVLSAGGGRGTPTASGSVRWVTVATAAGGGTTGPDTGKPAYLPADARLVRHDVDEYGVHVWVYSLGPPALTPAGQSVPVLLSITAVAADALQVPQPDDPTYSTRPVTVGSQSGRLLEHQAAGLVRLDFLRNGVAYTVISSRVPTAHGNAGPTDDDVVAIGASLSA